MLIQVLKAAAEYFYYVNTLLSIESRASFTLKSEFSKICTYDATVNGFQSSRAGYRVRDRRGRSLPMGQSNYLS